MGYSRNMENSVIFFYMVFNTRYIHIIIRMFQNSKGEFVNFLRRCPQSCDFQSI